MFEDISEVDRSYIAGFIDGEGWIGCNKSSHCTPVLDLTNTNFEAINRIYKTFGEVGYIRTRRDTRTNHKPVSAWVITGKLCKEVLICIKPYLRIKRLQAELAILLVSGESFMGSPMPKEELIRRLTLCSYLELLNKRGYKPPKEDK